MPKFLMIGPDSRFKLIDDLAAIAEVDPFESDSIRSFEATWQGETLRVETPVVRDLELIETRASDADFILLVISETDGIMPIDLAELEATPDRVAVAAVCCTNLLADPELSQIIRLEVAEVIKRKRPRWKEHFTVEDCDLFFFILKTSFFTDCL